MDTYVMEMKSMKYFELEEIVEQEYLNSNLLYDRKREFSGLAFEDQLQPSCPNQ